MPTYEYKCSACGHRFEAVQSMTEEPLTECPKCGKTVNRVIGRNVLISFKGSGFYVTDSSTSGAEKAPAEKKA